MIVKFFSVSFEFPLTLSEMQTSILAKLAAARMINTAVYVQRTSRSSQMYKCLGGRPVGRLTDRENDEEEEIDGSIGNAAFIFINLINQSP
jgi:hypothetical protein